MILGGTSAGRRLAEALASDARFAPVLSFAGRTQSLERPRVEHRVGGFGGVSGLVRYLERERCAAVVDATHPFAAQMRRHAALGAEQRGLPLLRLEGPPWRPLPGDRWLEVADMAQAAQALGAAPRRVFLAIGRLEIAAFYAAPQHDYLIRAVDDFPCELPRARVIAARGPFALAAELELFRRERIEVVVGKNAGIAATYAKLEAARALGLPAILVQRPRVPAVPTVEALEAALAWLSELHARSSRRGV